MKHSFKSKRTFMSALLGKYFGSSDHSIANGTATYRLDGERNVVITLASGQIENQFVGLLVAIVNRSSGEISKQHFSFKDYLTHDIRHKYAWPNNGNIEWYGTVPTDDSVTNMNVEIDHYISLWKSLE